MELFTYLMAKNDHNTSVKKDLFSYLLGKNQSGTYTDYFGTSLSINNTKKGKMKVNLLGNTSQTGTPTPSSPIPVNVVSGDNTIVSTGKNLYDLPQVGVKNGITYSKNSDGTFNLTGTATANTTFTLVKDLSSSGLTNGETYTFSANKTLPSGMEMRLGGLNGDTWVRNILNIALTSTTQSSTRTANTTDINRVSYQIYVANGTTINISNFGTQLEKGSSATTYEPYTSTSYPIHLGEYELCKISTYQDRFFKNIPNTTDYKSNLEDNEWYLEKKIGKVVLDGSEDITSSTTSVTNHYRYFIPVTNIKQTSSATEMPNILCSHYKSQVMGTAGGWGAHQGIAIDNVGQNIAINDDTYYSQDATAYKNWLSSNNVTVYYAHNTPTYTPITGTLKDELEALQKAQSYKGTTNINQINNDLPFNMDVSVKVGS